MSTAIMDMAGGGGINGNVTQRLLANGFDPRVLRPWIGGDGRSYISVNGKVQLTGNAATLRKLEWEQLDSAIIRESRLRLVGVADLEARGCVYNLNGMAKTILTSENTSEFTAAEMSMDAINKTQGDHPVYGTDYLPLPFTMKDFHLGARQLAVSRNFGEPLDTTGAELATRQVAELIEYTLFRGTNSYKFGPTGSIIYGYCDAPDRNTGSLKAAWDDSSMDGSEICADIQDMKQALIDDGFPGPYMLYYPQAYETKLDEDYNAYRTGTIRQRILQIAGITDAKMSWKLAANNVVLVQMTPDVVRMVNGMEITPIEWTEQGGMVIQYKVMAIKVPQIRSTYGDKCGVAHYKV